ncbi:MAG TPA: DUF2934 domain-containing protein [Bryobacteraceae bacterium]|jgi:hypothetical protein
MAARALASPKKTVTQPVPLEEKIRQRAHELYLQRGCEDGHDVEDWLQAEAEVRETVTPQTESV